MSHWFCTCECGIIINANVGKLKSGHTRSCGCLRLEGLSATHGESRDGKQSPEYQAFSEAKKRCAHPDRFPDYGGRGIEFRFESFEDFLVEVGRRPTSKHSLDRKDVNGHYAPGNVRWATKIVQARNTRVNRIITIDGVSKCVAKWAEVTGIKRIRLRLFRGWCERCAVTRPLFSSCPHRD